jgi:hypothetical protein
VGNKLKAGGLGAQSAGAIPAEFSGSMAKAIEDALNTLLQQEGRPQLPVDNSAETRDRRMLFVAIARGVVNHLVANQAAFTIHRDDGTRLAEHHVEIAEE